MDQTTNTKTDLISSSRRLDWLDALRGWAILGIVTVHSGGIAHSTGFALKASAAGQYGVQLFFIVSALTISMTYDSHIVKYGKSVTSQLAWLTKRFFRIAPLYYLAALFYPVEKYAIYALSHHRYGSTISIFDILINLLFLHTWVPSANNSVVPGGWSIGVEMFFYILVPIIWIIVPIRRRILLLCIAAGVLLSATYFVSEVWNGNFYIVNNTYLYYWFPSQAPAIIFGLIFYFLYGAKLGKPLTRMAAVLFFSGFCASFLLALYFGTGREVAPALAPAVLGIAFILLILSLQGWGRRIIVNALASRLGRISFSVYILHFLVLDIVALLIQSLHLSRSSPLTVCPILIVTLAVTSGLALISKRVIEDPAITYGHKLSQRLMRRSCDEVRQYQR